MEDIGEALIDNYAQVERKFQVDEVQFDPLGPFLPLLTISGRGSMGSNAARRNLCRASKEPASCLAVEGTCVVQ